MKRTMKWMGAMMIALWSASAGMAEDAGEAGEERMLTLEPMEVKAPPLPVLESEITSDFGGSVVTVTRSQIDGLNAQDLGAALKRVPGVNISRYNVIGAFGGGDGGAFYIRGHGAARPGSEIRVYVDGAPREVGVWAHPLLDIVNIDHAETVKVYKGPQPQEFGGLFGAVDVQSRRREQPGTETDIRFGYGSHETFVGQVHHGGREGKVDYYGGVSYKESDGHRDHSAGEVSSAMGRIGYTFSDEFNIAYILNATDNFAEDPGPASGPTPERERFDTETIDHIIRLEHNALNAEGFGVAWYEDGKIRWKQDRIGGPDSPPGASKTDWENYGFRGRETVRLDALSLTAGLEAESYGGESRTVAVSGFTPFEFDGRFEILSPSLGAVYEIPVNETTVLKPSAGVRYSAHDEFDDETAPHAGLTLEGQDWSLFGTYARGVHFPGVYIVGISEESVDVLEAETMDHFEVGGTLRLSEDLSVRAVGFHDEVSGFIVPPPPFRNAGEGELTGAELTGEFRLGERLSGFAGLTWLDTDPADYPRSPEWSTTAAVSVRLLDPVLLELDAQYVDEQMVGNRRSPEAAFTRFEQIDSYVLVNARLSYEFGGGEGVPPSRLYVAGENLTDEDYEVWADYPMPGAMVMAGAELRF